MQAFTQFTGIAAPLPIANIDTDKIIPARYMKTVRRSGLGIHLFEALRYDESGGERPDFVLNQEPYRHSRILLAHENFGCGSSREHAPWALLDFGIRCIIAPSFADIFHGNCYKNGILPIALPRNVCDQLMGMTALAPNELWTVDLERQTIAAPGGRSIPFSVDAFRRSLLLQGFDDIDVTLRHLSLIEQFEAGRSGDAWMFPAISCSPAGRE